MSKKGLLWDMTWEEAEEAFREADFIVLPTGSIEQHSTHLPVSCDSIRVEELVKHLVTHSGPLRMVMLPLLPYGQSMHHIQFPGTITIREDTYVNILRDIAWSVKQHGGRRLLIVNGHGGNAAPTEHARLMVERDIGLKVYYVNLGSFNRTNFMRDFIEEWAPGVPYGHACFYETSMIMKWRPDLVKREKMVKQEVRNPRHKPRYDVTRSASSIYFARDNYVQGGVGDPGLASLELAEKAVTLITGRVIEALIEDMKHEEASSATNSGASRPSGV